MLYFAQVQSTLKKGCNAQLGQRTVICGPNGAGKSTIVQSLELAANGWASDMEGRSRVKQSTALARLFPPDVMKYSIATLSDGTTFSWGLDDGARAGSFKKPNIAQPFSVAWPVQDLMDTLRGDAGTVGAWLEKQVVGGLTEEELLSELPPAVRTLVAGFVKKKGKTDFIALSKAAKQEAKNLRSQATRSESTIERMVEGIAPPLLDSMREGMEAQLASMTAPRSGVTQEEYDAARSKIDELVDAMLSKDESLREMTTLSPEVSIALDRLVTAEDLIKQHVAVFGKEECWVCGNEDERALDDQALRLKEVMATLHPQYLESVQRQLVKKERAVIESDLKVKADEFKQLTIAEEVDDTERKELLRKLASDDAAKKTWANAEASRKELDQLRSRADLLNLAGAALEKAGKRFLSTRKKVFEDEVSFFLPEGERIGVDLKSSRLGLMRDGEIHSALSGAEWSRVLLALASAQGLTENSMSVLVPEDRAWDRDTLGRVMQALSDAPVQVIIMSTVTPDPVEGWTCIEL
jgi:energy-coupling factor transporter ATP-binding protein EcfA2